MARSTNASIDKINRQIKVLKESEEKESVPRLSKKDIDRKIKLEKIDHAIEENKKRKTRSPQTSKKSKTVVEDKTMVFTGIKEKEKELKKLYEEKPKQIKKVDLKKKNTKSDKSKYSKEKMQKVKEQVDEVLDDSFKVNRILYILGTVFVGLLLFVFILVIFICTY